MSKKNFTPQQLSALTAIQLAIPISIGIFVLRPQWYIALISLLVVFTGSYFLILLTLQTFIYRKIKLIYKLISQTKATKKETFYYQELLPQKSIDEVREDVEEWARQKKAEVELLEKNERFRKEFLQNLSHELKTPIFAAQAYIDTLLDGALKNDEVNLKFLNKAARSIERLVNLVGSLDEISKLESGELQLNPTPFVIQDLTKEVFETLELKLSEKNIHAFIKKGCELPVTVLADKEKVRQVLTNIIDNAIKYGREGGQIEAGFYRLEGKTVLVEISDDGYGIGEEHMSRLFERFYRTDTARGSGAGGSGLGLSICKHIIEAHGHTMHIRSKKDVGTTVGFSLGEKG